MKIISPKQDCTNVIKKISFYESKEYYPIILIPEIIKDDINFTYSITDIAKKFNIKIPINLNPPIMNKPSKSRTFEEKNWIGKIKLRTELIPNEEYEKSYNRKFELIAEIQNKIEDEILEFKNVNEEIQKNHYKKDFSIESLIKSKISKNGITKIFNNSAAKLGYRKHLFDFDLINMSSSDNGFVRLQNETLLDWIKSNYFPKYSDIEEQINKDIIEIYRHLDKYLLYLQDNEIQISFKKNIEINRKDYESSRIKEIFSERFKESNHRRISNLPKKGSSELKFLSYLNKYFSNFIDIDCKLGEYYPDFLYYDEKTKIKIDIEIDEMISKETNLPIHEIGGKDEARNNYFINENWIVIRFTENQVKEYPEECCNLINSIIHNLSNPFNQKNIEIKTPKVKRWTYVEATLNK